MSVTSVRWPRYPEPALRRYMKATPAAAALLVPGYNEKPERARPFDADRYLADWFEIILSPTDDPGLIDHSGPPYAAPSEPTPGSGTSP